MKYSTIFIYSITLLILIYISNLILPLDSTDNIEKHERSGMSSYTDYLTECQYLKVGFFGSITPRLDAHGNHICNNSHYNKFE